MTITMKLPMNMHLVVLDDMRELPYELITNHTVHCKTNEEMDFWLDEMPQGEPVLAFLDHDAGGVAFGSQTFREGITKMVDAHIEGDIEIVIAYVITMNPAGQEWIRDELERGDIDFAMDPAGGQLGMRCPKGFGVDADGNAV